jgi:hypothetical protein
MFTYDANNGVSGTHTIDTVPASLYGRRRRPCAKASRRRGVFQGRRRTHASGVNPRRALPTEYSRN